MQGLVEGCGNLLLRSQHGKMSHAVPFPSCVKLLAASSLIPELLLYPQRPWGRHWVGAQKVPEHVLSMLVGVRTGQMALVP